MGNTIIKIRAFENNTNKDVANDYAAIASIMNTIDPESPQTPEDLRFWDEQREKKCKWGWLLAEKNNCIVGFARFLQPADHYHPNVFHLGLMVLPEHQHTGIGGALMQELNTVLTNHAVISARINVKSSRKNAIDFLETRGFKEEFLSWESRMNPQEFDAAPYEDLFASIASHGIEMISVGQLATQATTASGWQKELWMLDNDIGRDMPDPEPYTDQSFERFSNTILKAPDFSADSWLVAVKKNQEGNYEYLAESVLWHEPNSHNASNGATGTRPAWRRKGLALALKVKNIVWAKEQGIEEIKTFNDNANQAMIAINQALGFKQLPAWVWMVKHF